MPAASAPRTIRGILLAGGASARFGAPKLLHPWKEGLTLGQAAARNLVAGVGNALAVVRTGDEALAALLRDAGCEILMSDRCREGMGASLAAGVAASREASGWVIALADMPRVAPEHSQAVARALAAGATLAAPVHGPSAERGHPVGFGAALLPELLALSGDQGAREIVSRHADALAAIPVDDPGILFDVDARADL